MTSLVVRKIPWDFDATVPFMWQTANPNFGLFCNAFTFIAVPFERYIVAVVRKAADRLNQDPDVASEADAFLRQEAQHAAAHRKHMIALVARYPDLERCYEDACTAYDELIDGARYRHDDILRSSGRKVTALLSTNYGGLVPEDELLAHQIVDTFATVSQSDPSWTEKIWTIAHARDNSLQVVLGIGKYTNRGVFDGAAGVCRGTEQWTVRAGRRLSSDPAGTHVGPIHYRVVEPLREIRVSLDATEHAPIAFDVALRGAFDAALEDPWPDRSPDGYRVTHNVLRYHQVGVASGWVDVEGHRTEIDADNWISIRDHSWGLRPGVGKPIPGLPRGGRKIKQMFMTWLPMTMTRPDGSAYSLFVMYQEERGDGFLEIRCQAEQQNADGTTQRFVSVEQDLHFQDDNRRFAHGTITLIESDGSRRPLTITAAGPTGFHLGTAGYYGWNDWVYGQWVGEERIEGNHVTDCDKPENARELHQLRDLLVRVEDPVGGGSGLGNAETFALGAFPERGLTAENSFL